MTHMTLPRFWRYYRELPKEVQKLADKNRALGTEKPDGILWFWIGPHAKYDQLLP